jgi:hypothetical protein
MVIARDSLKVQKAENSGSLDEIMKSDKLGFLVETSPHSSLIICFVFFINPKNLNRIRNDIIIGRYLARACPLHAFFFWFSFLFPSLLIYLLTVPVLLY